MFEQQRQLPVIEVAKDPINNRLRIGFDASNEAGPAK
jgi:hypothetical protein